MYVLWILHESLKNCTEIQVLTEMHNKIFNFEIFINFVKFLKILKPLFNEIFTENNNWHYKL